VDWLGWFVPRTLRKVPTESLAPPEEGDLAQLRRLREAGSRLDLPHPVRGFLRFDSEARAREAADALEAQGYSPQVRTRARDGWTVTAVATLVPTPGAITRLREQLTAVASSHEGEYAGWQAPPVY
jgi:hypothetical protein